MTPESNFRIRQLLLECEAELLKGELDRLAGTSSVAGHELILSDMDRIQSVTAALADRDRRVAELELQILTSAGQDPSWGSLPLASKIEQCLGVLDGWCTPAKASWLAKFIIDRDMKSVVEIGIFGGKSLVPIVLALQETSGTAIGVEPWSNTTAVAEATGDANDNWWKTVDLGLIKTRFYANSIRFNVLRNMKILEMDSEQAFDLIKSKSDLFDMVHIDGAHSPDRALSDAKNWSKLVRKGGLVIFDDIAWPSVAAARSFLTENLKVVEEIIEPGQASYGAYEV